ncbi:MAG: epoxide hydrolase family protein [Chroococcidiopsis sp.]
MSIESFKVEISKETLEDLRERLANTRLPDEVEGADWDYGTNLAYLKELATYWQNKFDWRSQEEALNRFAHFRADVDGFGLHFIHERGQGENPLPIVLTHGYPDSFWRFQKLIPLLVEEKDGISFDVVVPSIPGYGFSDKPKEKGMLFKVADLWTKLMTEELGYTRFAAHGGDLGGTITEHLARSYGDSLVGIHLTDVPFSHLSEKPDDLSAVEERFFAECEKWQKEERAYAMIQGTKPQSLAYGLNDSPAGLAAWLVEKFRAWSDCGGDIETRFTKDELLTNITIYWATETINSSFRLYYDAENAGAMTWIAETLKKWTGSSNVPTGFAIFPKDILPPPREWAERFFNIQQWTEMPHGGHFAAFEEPKLLAEDIRAFFRPLRGGR